MASVIHRKYLLNLNFGGPGGGGSPWYPLRRLADRRDHGRLGVRLPAISMTRTLQGVRCPGVEPAWPGNPPGYTLASPSPTEPEVRSQIGSQEPIRIGPRGVCVP